MSRPISVRTGMFCRFGFVLLRRPVAATVCWKSVWMRPSSGETAPGSASRYVDFSFVSCRYWKMASMIG